MPVDLKRIVEIAWDGRDPGCIILRDAAGNRDKICYPALSNVEVDGEMIASIAEFHRAPREGAGGIEVSLRLKKALSCTLEHGDLWCR